MDRGFYSVEIFLLLLVLKVSIMFLLIDYIFKDVEDIYRFNKIYLNK